MVSDTVSFQLARIGGQQELILQEMKDAKESRKTTYSAIEEIRLSASSIESRVQVLEDSLTKFTPTIEEFTLIKQKVIGAGAVGKWLWIIGVALVGLVYKFREGVLEWLLK